DLRLFRLTEKFVGLDEVTNLDLRFGLLDKTARQRDLRIERRKLFLKLLKLIGNLGELLLQLFKRHLARTASLVTPSRLLRSTILSASGPVAPAAAPWLAPAPAPA